MADLAYTTTIQSMIAQAVFGKPYSGLLTNEKALIDATWSSGALAGGEAYFAFQRVTQRAQAFYLGGATAAPDVWENVLVAETAARVARTVRPDRWRAFAAEREETWRNALESFTLDAVTASALAGQDITVQGIRYYVIAAGARLNPRRFFDVGRVDAETQWVLNYAWNRSGWNIRRRQARMRLRRISVTGATWTESTKTLTKTGAFASYTHTAGARVMVLTGAAEAVAGDYIVSSKTSDNAIVLTTSLGAAADADTDVAFDLTWIEFVGLGASETFDSVATREWYYDGDSGIGANLVWADSDEMAMQKAVLGSNRGRPVLFRTENRAGTLTWYFAPEPDAAYTARGEVYIAGPGTPATATETTVFNKFPSEMRPHLRDLVLGRVFTRHGIAEGERIFQRAVEDVSSLFPAYEDAGSPDDSPWPRDVYADIDCLGGQIGGAL